jgi:hypothetical protein
VPLPPHGSSDGTGPGGPTISRHGLAGQDLFRSTKRSTERALRPVPAVPGRLGPGGDGPGSGNNQPAAALAGGGGGWSTAGMAGAHGGADPAPPAAPRLVDSLRVRVRPTVRAAAEKRSEEVRLGHAGGGGGGEAERAEDGRDPGGGEVDPHLPQHHPQPARPHWHPSARPPGLLLPCPVRVVVEQSPQVAAPGPGLSDPSRARASLTASSVHSAGPAGRAAASSSCAARADSDAEPARRGPTRTRQAARADSEAPGRRGWSACRRAGPARSRPRSPPRPAPPGLAAEGAVEQGWQGRRGGAAEQAGAQI